jgi:hypothetical protein
MNLKGEDNSASMEEVGGIPVRKGGADHKSEGAGVRKWRGGEAPDGGGGSRSMRISASSFCVVRRKLSGCRKVR